MASAASEPAAGCGASAAATSGNREDAMASSSAQAMRLHHSRPWGPTAANDSTFSALFRMREAKAGRHALENVISEKVLAVHRHHHDLHLVRQPLRHDL